MVALFLIAAYLGCGVGVARLLARWVLADNAASNIDLDEADVFIVGVSAFLWPLALVLMALFALGRWLTREAS